MKKDKHFSFRCTDEDWEYISNIAELDDTPFGTVEDQIKKLNSIGFSVTERYGQVIVMSR